MRKKKKRPLKQLFTMGRSIPARMLAKNSRCCWSIEKSSGSPRSVYEMVRKRALGTSGKSDYVTHADGSGIYSRKYVKPPNWQKVSL